MLRSGSAGFMCLVVAAHESRYFNDNGKLVRFPLRKLQLDCKSNVSINSIRGTVDIDFCEIKPISNYSTSIRQLGLILGCVRWFFQSHKPFEHIQIRLIGTVIARANIVMSLSTKHEFAKQACCKTVGLSVT
jgi:hypothetical protein